MTRRATVLASCLIAVFAVSAAISALASASMTLPSFSGTAATTGTVTAGAGSLTVSGGASINCESGSAKYGLESGSRHLGTATITFSGCTQGGEKCRSLGDALGTILVTGSWHLVLYSKPADAHYILGLLSELHVECPGAAVKLLLVKGDLLGSTAAQAGSETKFGITVKDNGGKAQEFSEFENEAGTAVKAGLETQQEGGKAKTSFEESANNVVEWNGATKIEN